MRQGVARIFQRGVGGGGSHCVKVRVLIRLSCRLHHLLEGCLLKKAHKGGHRHPRTPLATPLQCSKYIHERSISAVCVAKFGPLAEPIRIFLLIGRPVQALSLSSKITREQRCPLKRSPTFYAMTSRPTCLFRFPTMHQWSPTYYKMFEQATGTMILLVYVGSIVI